MSEFVKGELVRVSGAFTNAVGAAADPTAVLFKYMDPEGTVIPLTYGVDAALVRDSLGNFHVDINASQSGTWKWRFYATGTGQTAEEGSFTVSESDF